MAWNLSDPDEDALIGWDDSEGDVIVYSLGTTLTTSTTTLDVDNTTVVTIGDAQTITGAKTFSDDVTVNATKKIFLDGGDDTYIHESSANVIALVAGGTERFRAASFGVGIPASSKLHLDGVVGTGNTYLQEVSADTVRIVAGGAAVVDFKAGELRLQGVKLAMPSGAKLLLDGASGTGDTYIHESSANTVDIVTGGTTSIRAKADEVTFTGTLKNTTGDPTGVEGRLTINTFDNAIKIYADGAWRTLTTW